MSKIITEILHYDFQTAVNKYNINYILFTAQIILSELQFHKSETTAYFLYVNVQSVLYYLTQICPCTVTVLVSVNSIHKYYSHSQLSCGKH